MSGSAGVAAVAIVMGLNLLELLPLRLPSLDVDVRTLQAPPILQVAPTNQHHGHMNTFLYLENSTKTFFAVLNC